MHTVLMIDVMRVLCIVLHITIGTDDFRSTSEADVKVES